MVNQRALPNACLWLKSKSSRGKRVYRKKLDYYPSKYSLNILQKRIFEKLQNRQRKSCLYARTIQIFIQPKNVTHAMLLNNLLVTTTTTQFLRDCVCYRISVDLRCCIVVSGIFKTQNHQLRQTKEYQFLIENFLK
ncbi:unnamed protein product [Ceratitis capitata]|uniref:(Mediterranean fruit fly) hypothetical protein n=1 Tax=Ceratitis capitata TaxID=7213 RepID=A0A811VBE7_CERCA|nr:unnamed protein product [Ceratitis capitata]